MAARTDARRVLMGLAHKAAAQLGMDDETRRAVQQAVTGKASCKDMSEAELRRLLWHYKAKGVDIGIPGPAPRGGQGWTRPTPWQWAEIERLALALGWDGLEDGRLLAFVRRTAQVDGVRFLTRRQATGVITGLRRWVAQRERSAGQRPVDRRGGTV